MKVPTLLIACMLCSVVQLRSQPSISVDGEMSEIEWEDSERHTLPGVEIYITYYESIVFIGLKGQSQGWAHVYLSANDSIWILHASAALGTATYVKVNNGWESVSCYNWELRDSTITDETTAKMETYYNQNGWVANNSSMSKSHAAEFKINLNAFSQGTVRLAMLYTSSSMNPPVYPESIGDSTSDEEIVYGKCPMIVEFTPEKWKLLQRKY